MSPQVDSVVTFALLEGDSATFYRRTGADQGLEKGKTFTQTGLLAALALSDGTQVLASAQGLARTDGTSIPLTEGEIIIELNQTGTGLCYVDGAGLQVFYADFTDWQPYPILDLQKEAYDLDRCTDLWITREGGLLLLMDGQTLLLDRGSTVSDLSGMLYPSALRCGLILGGLGLAVLVLSLAVWYVVCEQRRVRLPLLVRWGVLMALVAVLGTAVLVRGGVALNGMWNRRQCTKFNGAPYVVQRGAAAVYTPEGRAQVRETIGYYLNNARVIREGLAGAGLTVCGGENSPYVWARTPDGLDSWAFFDRLLQQANVVTTPGAGFGPSGEGYIRLTAFGGAEDTVEAVERIKAIL